MYSFQGAPGLLCARMRILSIATIPHIRFHMCRDIEFCADARPRTLGTLPDDASRLMRGVTTQRLVGLRPPPCVVPPRKPVGFRQRTETRKPPSWHTKAHEISRSDELQSQEGIFFVSFRVGRRPAFVTGATMKPAGLAVAWTRRPAKPGRGADAAAPSRQSGDSSRRRIRGRALALAIALTLVE